MSAHYPPMVVAAARALCQRNAALCGTDAEDEWKFYGDHHLADAQAALAAAGVVQLTNALQDLLMRDEANTCQHESTYRGGTIWTICEQCGQQWADDEGGKPEWSDPPEWIAARNAIARVTGGSA